MSNYTEKDDCRTVIKNKLRQCFDGKIVRKDLTKKIKEGANVPIYVLEFLLGQYCSSDDEEVIERGVQNVKRILSDNFVRPDEAQKVLSRLRKKGSYTIIDMVTARLDMKRNLYVASFSNLGITNVLLDDEYPEKYDRLLCGGIWCIVQLDYEYIEEEKKNGMPVQIRKLTPIQMPHVEIEELKEGRKQFTEGEWLDIMMRSIGMEPDKLTEREKWLLLLRMVPLVENNFNLCELGPRSTGKSHLYKEISPNSILVSGGQHRLPALRYGRICRPAVATVHQPGITVSVHSECHPQRCTLRLVVEHGVVAKGVPAIGERVRHDPLVGIGHRVGMVGSRAEGLRAAGMRQHIHIRHLIAVQETTVRHGGW